MKLRYFLIAVILITIISCKKDGGSGLSIKVESVSSNIIPDNGSLSIVLSFVDNGGHPIDSVYMKKIRINQDTLASNNIQPDTFYLIPPSYPGNTKGQIQFDLGYNNFLPYAIYPPKIGNPPQDESDSLIFKFAAKDNANNKSDTVSTGVIVIERVN
jgi:hypothetical protein